jgi:hypothetical protein
MFPAFILNKFSGHRQNITAIRRAMQRFESVMGFRAMGGHVLRTNPGEVIVRVMYMTDRIPPDRSWFGVSTKDESIRELSFAEVESLETPWR